MIARLLISPSLEVRINEINGILSKENFTLKSPDLLYYPYDSRLGIGEARKIKEHFSIKPYSAKGRMVVLEDASALTVEAQNALLKTLEEPPEEAILLLGAKSESDLLPTVLSRCQIVILDSSPVISSSLSLRAEGLSEAKDIYSSPAAQNDIGKLLSSSIEDRFEYIEKLKDREEFLHSLVVYFREALHAPRQRPFGSEPQGRRLARLESQKFLKELLQSEEWAAQNVNIRGILEYLMLVMPQTEV